MTNRPVEPSPEPVAHATASGQVSHNPETDTQGRPEPDQDQPAEVESGDVAQEPADPAEEPGVDPPLEDSGQQVRDSSRLDRTDAGESLADS